MRQTLQCVIALHPDPNRKQPKGEVSRGAESAATNKIAQKKILLLHDHAASRRYQSIDAEHLCLTDLVLRCFKKKSIKPRLVAAPIVAAVKVVHSAGKTPLRGKSTDDWRDLVQYV